MDRDSPFPSNINCNNDDTTMKILANLKKIEADDERSGKGSFTTGVLAVRDQRPIALFFTGPKHAGKNMAQLLEQRASGLSPPIQMCDALSRNVPKEFETLLANCLAHARRNFVDLVPSFPEQCRYVIEALAKVYHHDKMTKNKVYRRSNASGSIRTAVAHSWQHSKSGFRKN